MSLFSRIAAAAKAFTGSSRATVPDWAEQIIGHPFIPPESLEEDFKDAFRKVPMVAAAISRVQHDVASLPWRVWSGEGPKRKEVQRKDGNLADLLKRANPRDTGYQLRVATVGALKTHGNAYWFLQRFPGRKEPAELWNLPPHLVEVVPGAGRNEEAYTFNRFGTKEPIAAENIIHFRKYNPDDFPVGMSELEPVRRDYEAQFYALVWLREFYRKGGMVSGVWALTDGGKKLKDSEIQAIMDRLNRLHVGYRKAWDPVVIEGLEFIKRGLTLGEMEIETSINMMNADLCRAIGVPPWMMGIKEGSNLGTSGAGVDQLDYVLGTLKREATLIDTTLNEQLAPLFGDGLEIETDFSGHLAIQGVMLEQAKSLVIAAGRPVITVNESRSRMGLEESDDPTADELFVRAVPTLGGTDGGQGAEPSPPAPTQSQKASRLQAMIDGDVQREQLRRRASSAIDRAYSRMLGMLHARLREQEQVINHRLETRYFERLPKAEVTGEAHNSRRTKLLIDLDGLMSIEDPTADEAKVRAILERLLRERGLEALAELGDLVDIAEGIEINLQAERVQRFLDAQVDRAIIVPDGTTAQMLRESLAEGVGADETLGELTARVRSVFEARGNMAATIARTETVPGFNLATQEAWLAADVVDAQEWLTARDDQVRPAHANADGEQVKIGEPFTVGGEQLAYPGDPSGEPGNTINCRCTLIPVISQDARQQARWKGYLGNGHAVDKRTRNRLREWFNVSVRNA